MEELLKEFYEAWERSERYYIDYKTYPSGTREEWRRSMDAVERVAMKIRAASAAQSHALPAGAHEDIPGQMYLTDLPVATLAADASQRGAA